MLALYAWYKNGNLKMALPTRLKSTGKRSAHFLSESLIYPDLRVKERTCRAGDHGDGSLRFLSQYNATGEGNWRAVPANSTIIRSVGVL